MVTVFLWVTQGHFTHETESPWPIHFKHSHWWKRQSRSKFATSHYARGTNGGCMWMQDGCKVCMDSYVASYGSCFMVTWTILEKYFTEVGLTQNWETMALWMLKTIDFLFYFYHVWGPTRIKIHWYSIWSRAWSHTRSGSHCTREDAWPQYMMLEVCWNGLWTLSFGLSKLHGHGSWLVCEVAVSARWLANPHRSRRRQLPHNFRCSYEYLLHCQNEFFRAH